MKKFLEQLKEYKKDPKGKAILFFGFYLVFFALLILFIRFGHNTKTDANEYERGSATSFFTENYENGNYEYTYKVILDDKEYLYQGKKDGEKERFTYQEKEYYFNGNDYFVDEETWVKCDNPYRISAYRDSKKVLELIGKSFFESKTTYESGKETSNYKVSTDTIQEVFQGITSDTMDDGNSLVVSADETGEISSISLHLDSYCKTTKSCEKNLKIEIDLNHYGEVKELKSPF